MKQNALGQGMDAGSWLWRRERLGHGGPPSQRMADFAAFGRWGIEEVGLRDGGCSWASGSRIGGRSSSTSRPFAPAKPLAGRSCSASGGSLGEASSFEVAS